MCYCNLDCLKVIQKENDVIQTYPKKNSQHHIVYILLEHVHSHSLNFLF